MLAEGRFITPVLHGEAYYHKPPLLYWLVMGCYRLFGVHDWAARLVPATAGVLLVLLTCAWGIRAVGRWAGLLAAAMLCLSAKFIYQAGMLTFDSLMALWVLGSLAAAHRAAAEGTLRRGWWLLAGALCGLGVLTKGPVSLLLVAPPLAVWQFLDRRTARLGARDWLQWLGLTFVVAGPWFILVCWRDPQALVDFVWTHHLLRYLAPLDHAEPVWYYVLPLFVGMLPWSLVALPFVRHLMRRSGGAARRRPAALGLFLLAFLWCFAFFSLSGCKRQGYILPAFPCLALVLGTYLANAFAWDRVGAWVRLRAHPGWNAWCHRVTLASLGVAALVGAAAGLRGIWSWPWVALWGLVMASALLLFARRGPARSAWRSAALCGVTVFVLLLGAVHELLPGYHRLFALRGQVRRHRDLDMPVASYPKRWDSVSFYLQRNDVEAYTPQRRAELIDDLRRQRRTLLFVKQGAALDDLLEALPEDMEFVPRGRSGAVVAAGLVQVRD
jgi:4-amino-4-deoxy-L-arabinose transferase-like glycosyltransferase